MLRLLIQSLKIIVVAVVGLLVFAGVRQLYDTFVETPVYNTDDVIISIRPGDGPADISQTLVDAGVIRSGVIFRTLVRLRNAGGKFTAGDHKLVRGMSMNQIIDVLTAPPRYDVDEVSVTFPEGRRVQEYAAILKQAGVIDNEQAFVDATKEDYDLSFLRFRPNPKDVGLEGYLFPDTYRFVRGTKPREVITRMLRNFEQRVMTPEALAQAEAQKRNIHQVLIIASIVEREAQVAGERRTIAGVYVNRLNRGMPLQADPTVQYAIGKPGDWWPKGDALAAALRQASPYNTYLSPSLPPGPIANPGLEAIRAALDPEPHDYLYFVAKGDGSHAFARTLDEHNANVQRFGNRNP